MASYSREISFTNVLGSFHHFHYYVAIYDFSKKKMNVSFNVLFDVTFFTVT